MFRANKELLRKELKDVAAEIEAAKGHPIIKEKDLIPGVYELAFDLQKLRKDPEIKVLPYY